jgi:hypothetical protein
MRRDGWAIGLFAVHLVHALGLGLLYPNVVYDPDLLAYFVYFRQWLAHTNGLHGISYFTVPKPLLVFVFGPFASVPLAFACSAVASALLGVLVYLIGRAVFGRTAGVLLSLVLLLDVEKMTLTLRSSADLWVAFFLCLSIYLSIARRLRLSSLCLLLSALVKPVTVPCALHFLVRDGVDRRTRWLATAIPFLAVPLILLSNLALLGTATGPGDFFSSFGALGEGAAIGPDEVMHFVFWTQLARHTFVLSAPWGLVGFVLWLRGDKERLTSPYLLVPVLFVVGYVALSVVAPYVPFFRFFWLLEIWFAGFIIFGMQATAAFIARGRSALRIAVTSAAMLCLVWDYGAHLAYYRDHFAVPFDSAMGFVTTTPDVLRRERLPGETIITPLAFMPYLMWQLGVDDPRRVFVTPEQEVVQHAVPRPDWILFVPTIVASRAAHDYMIDLVSEGGYELRASAGGSALFARPALSHAPVEDAPAS